MSVGMRALFMHESRHLHQLLTRFADWPVRRVRVRSSTDRIRSRDVARSTFPAAAAQLICRIPR
jgi:hypothetical protein